MGDMADYYRELDFEDDMFQPHWLINPPIPKDLSWWVQKNGERIKVTDMSDEHPVNSINMIDRNQWRLYWKETLMLELESR